MTAQGRWQTSLGSHSRRRGPARVERPDRGDHGVGGAAGTGGDLEAHEGGAGGCAEPRGAARQPNGAAALRRAGKGGAPLRTAIARNADRHARDLAPVVEDIRSSITSLEAPSSQMVSRAASCTTACSHRLGGLCEELCRNSRIRPEGTPTPSQGVPSWGGWVQSEKMRSFTARSPTPILPSQRAFSF